MGCDCITYRYKRGAGSKVRYLWYAANTPNINVIVMNQHLNHGGHFVSSTPVPYAVPNVVPKDWRHVSPRLAEVDGPQKRAYTVSFSFEADRSQDSGSK